MITIFMCIEHTNHTAVLSTSGIITMNRFEMLSVTVRYVLMNVLWGLMYKTFFKNCENFPKLS